MKFIGNNFFYRERELTKKEAREWADALVKMDPQSGFIDMLLYFSESTQNSTFTIGMEEKFYE